MDRKEFKSAAKEQIKGKIGVLFVINLIVSLITSAASGIPGLGILCGLIVTPAFAIALSEYISVLPQAKSLRSAMYLTASAISGSLSR